MNAENIDSITYTPRIFASASGKKHVTYESQEIPVQNWFLVTSSIRVEVEW